MQVISASSSCNQDNDNSSSTADDEQSGAGSSLLRLCFGAGTDPPSGTVAVRNQVIANSPAMKGLLTACKRTMFLHLDKQKQTVL